MANNNTTTSNETESLADLLTRTVRDGAPIYNAGDPQGCYELYLVAAQQACVAPALVQSAVGQLLEQATVEAQDTANVGGDYKEAAWVSSTCGTAGQH